MKKQTEREKRDELLQVATQLTSCEYAIGVDYELANKAAIRRAKNLIAKVNAEFEG